MIILFFSLEKRKTKRRHILKEIVDIQWTHNEGRGIDDNEHGFSLLPVIALCGVKLYNSEHGQLCFSKTFYPFTPLAFVRFF